MNVDNTPVTPAFRRPLHALAYCVVVGLVLLGPIIVSMWPGLTVDRLLSSAPSTAGDFTFLHKQIYEEKSDIDILFIGSSMVWADMNAAVVQKRLEEACGGKRNVLTFGYNWPGEDQKYFLLRELLARRRVHMVVMQFPHIDQFQFVPSWPHVRSQFWFQWNDKDILQGLKTGQILSYYAQSLIGAPRAILSGIRPDIRGQLIQVNDANGTQLYYCGYNGAKWEQFAPPPVQFSPEESTYSLNPAEFSFSRETINDFQYYYACRILDLLKRHNVAALAINLPDRDHVNAKTAIERCKWTEIMERPLDIIGISPKKLFAGLSESDVDKLFWNPFHLNINGNEYFSNAISPAIIRKYKQATAR